MFPMIEPDVVPPGDGSGEPVLLQQTFKGSAWLGQRMFWSWSHFRLVNQDKSSKIKVCPCISMIFKKKTEFDRIRSYWVSYIILVPGPSKYLENSGNIPIILRTCGNFDGLEGLRYVDTWDTHYPLESMLVFACAYPWFLGKSLPETMVFP